MQQDSQNLLKTRDDLLNKINTAGSWTPAEYEEVINLGKRLEVQPSRQFQKQPRPKSSVTRKVNPPR